jgi:hypothetical protein
MTAARANLVIEEGLRSAFLTAQETRTVRFLKIKIIGELITLHSVTERHSNAENDFDNLFAPTLLDNEAAFYFYCLTDDDSPTLGKLQFNFYAVRSEMQLTIVSMDISILGAR